MKLLRVHYCGYFILLASFLDELHAVDPTCTESDPNCVIWASKGYCHTSTDVYNKCVLSCHRCSSSSGSSTTSFTESSDCVHNTYYNHLKSLIGNKCAPMDNQWYYLYHLTNSNHAHCARDAAIYLRDYFKAHPVGTSCGCSTTNTTLTNSPSSTYTLGHCRRTDKDFRDIFSTTFNSSNPSLGRRCMNHAEEWEKLAAVSENSCFIELVHQFYLKFFTNHDGKCSCSSTTGGGGNTQLQSQHTTDSCLQYSQYRYLNNLIEHDTCVSHYEVWKYLDDLSSLRVYCRTHIIARLRNTYGHFSHTPSNCTCNTQFSSLRLYNDPHGYYQDCKNDHHYYALMSRLTSHNQVCSSHHTVWSDLSAIPHFTNHRYSYCQKDAISHLQVSASHVSTPCTCSPSSVVASTLPPTHPPTSAPAAPDVRMCDSLALTVGLAYGDVLQEGPFTCSDGRHALSEAAPMRLCNATDSSMWTKGQQVVPNCDSIPKYSAIASFAGSIYTHDGLAGVFLGCNATHMTIASEDCTHGISLFQIPLDNRDSYTHSARNYYTILWFSLISGRYIVQTLLIVYCGLSIVVDLLLRQR